jgi:hypothetical protein
MSESGLAAQYFSEAEIFSRGRRAEKRAIITVRRRVLPLPAV